MASEPTDLIREADAALDGITPGEWRHGRDNLGFHTISAVRTGVVYATGQPGEGMRIDNPADAEFIAAAPDLVRRLRDALEAERDVSTGLVSILEEREAEVHRLRAELCEWANSVVRLTRERDEAKAALAEANATIQRVKAVLDRSSRLVHLDHFIRRAIEGSSHERP